MRRGAGRDEAGCWFVWEGQFESAARMGYPSLLWPLKIGWMRAKMVQNLWNEELRGKILKT